jgi:hypothetical protein
VLLAKGMAKGYKIEGSAGEQVIGQGIGGGGQENDPQNIDIQIDMLEQKKMNLMIKYESLFMKLNQKNPDELLEQ